MNDNDASLKSSYPQNSISSDREYLPITLHLVILFSLLTIMPASDLEFLIVAKYTWILISLIFIINKISSCGIHSLIGYIEYCRYSIGNEISAPLKLSLLGCGFWLVAVIFKENTVILLTFIPASLFFFVWASLAYLESYSIVAELMGYKCTNLMVLLIGTMFIYCSNLLVVKEIEYITGVEASNFEYTRALSVFYCGFLLFSLVVFIIAVLSLFCNYVKKMLWGGNKYASYKEDFYFAFSMLPIFVMGVFSSVNIVDGESRKVQLSNLVEYLDMLHNPICNGLDVIDGEEKYPVAFLSSNMDTILYKKESKYYLGQCSDKQK